MGMRKLTGYLTNEKGNSLVENIIVLPLVFIIIIAMILFSFVMHDRATLEGAAIRGTIFAAHMISDPNYIDILSSSGAEYGQLDTNLEKTDQISFAAYGTNYHTYSIFGKNTNSVKTQTQQMIKKTIDNTRIPWREIDIDSIKVEDQNNFFFHNVKVTISATYPLPDLFGNLGLPTELKYDVEATAAVNDADDFIRNADLVVDIIVRIDQATGNHISEAAKKIEQLASKLTDFLDITK